MQFVSGNYLNIPNCGYLVIHLDSHRKVRIGGIINYYYSECKDMGDVLYRTVVQFDSHTMI